MNQEEELSSQDHPTIYDKALKNMQYTVFMNRMILLLYHTPIDPEPTEQVDKLLRHFSISLKYHDMPKLAAMLEQQRILNNLIADEVRSRLPKYQK